MLRFRARGAPYGWRIAWPRRDSQALIIDAGALATSVPVR